MRMLSVWYPGYHGYQFSATLAGEGDKGKLMEEPDTLEADRIAQSEPRIVLQMPVDAGSKTA